MFSWLSNAWRVPELRHRVLFTAMILGLYRLGCWIPVPGVNSDAIDSYFSGQGGTILGLLNIFSGGALGQFALFALGIMPYVTASIILQLMTVVIPRLEQLQKEGEAGYAKINQYTRYLTVALAALQAAGYSYLFNRQIPDFQLNSGRFVLIVVSLTAATMMASAITGNITRSYGVPLYQARIPPGSAERIEAKMRSEMPLPIPRFVISSPIHMSSVVDAVRVTVMSTTRPAFRSSAP